MFGRFPRPSLDGRFIAEKPTDCVKAVVDRNLNGRLGFQPAEISGKDFKKHIGKDNGAGDDKGEPVSIIAAFLLFSLGNSFFFHAESSYVLFRRQVLLPLSKQIDTPLRNDR